MERPHAGPAHPDFDRRLAELYEQFRSLDEIAGELGLPPEAAWQRLQELAREGTIPGGYYR